MLEFHGWVIPPSKLTAICLKLSGVRLSSQNTNYSVLAIKLTVMITSMVQAVISLCLHWARKKNEVFRIVNDLNAIVYGTCLIVTFGLYNGKISQLFSSLQQGLFKYSTQLSVKQQKAKVAAALRIKIVERVFIVSSVLGTFTFFFSPLVFGLISFHKGEAEDFLLPLSPWFPFTINSRYMYLTIFMFEFLISLLVVIYHISWQSSLYSSILCLQGEMRILALAITDIEVTARLMANNRRRRDIYYYTEQCLKECVQHHQMIIKCVSLVNGAFKIIILEYLQSCTFIFCLNAMRLALTPLVISVTTVTSLGEVVPVLLQFWLICWFGQLLRNEDEMLRQTCYQSSWIHQPLSIKRTLHVMVTRCNKPLCLSSGLYTVDMRTYSQILQAAYSYFNFLLSSRERFN